MPIVNSFNTSLVRLKLGDVPEDERSYELQYQLGTSETILHCAVTLRKHPLQYQLGTSETIHEIDGEFTPGPSFNTSLVRLKHGNERGHENYPRELQYQLGTSETAAAPAAPPALNRFNTSLVRLKL